MEPDDPSVPPFVPLVSEAAVPLLLPVLASSREMARDNADAGAEAGVRPGLHTRCGPGIPSASVEAACTPLAEARRLIANA